MADKFLRGAMILTMAGLMVKILGSVNRILLSRFLGGEGIGLYQMAYPVFLLMLSVSSSRLFADALRFVGGHTDCHFHHCVRKGCQRAV